MARVRADEHGCLLRVCAARRGALPHPAGERRAGRRLRRPAVRHAVELRSRLGRAHEGDPDHDGRVRARERSVGRGRARPAARGAERPRARHRRHDREVLAHRRRPCQGDDRLLDRAEPEVGRLPDHGAGRRSRRDRQRRRERRLGGRLRQASRRTAVRRRGPGSRRLRARRDAGDHDRREPCTRPHQRRLLLRRRDRGRHDRRGSRARRGRGQPRHRPSGCGSRHRAHRQQQHGQRAEADLGQPRLRPSRLHPRRFRRRRRHARRGAGHGARHAKGRHPSRSGRLLGLGNADDGSPARLFRHASHPASRRQHGQVWRTARRGDGDGSRAIRGRRRGPSAGSLQALREHALREPGTLRRDPPGRRGDRPRGDRTDRRDVPRALRAGVHVPPRCADRGRGCPSRRDR